MGAWPSLNGKHWSPVHAVGQEPRSHDDDSVPTGTSCTAQGWCPDALEALAAEIAGVPLACDGTKPADLRDVAETVGEPHDVLINNADGAITLNTIEDSDPEDWRQAFELNVLRRHACHGHFSKSGFIRRRHDSQSRIDRGTRSVRALRWVRRRCACAGA
jgi:NAD(P)-dependent dehydrogenase (short-subunit alcohol dehydrogenase family)